jgi:hypothetical protein
VLQIELEKLVSFGAQNQTVRPFGSVTASAAGSISVTFRPAPALAGSNYSYAHPTTPCWWSLSLFLEGEHLPGTYRSDTIPTRWPYLSSNKLPAGALTATRAGVDGSPQWNRSENYGERGLLS